MRVPNRKIIWIFALCTIILGGGAGGYLYFSDILTQEKSAQTTAVRQAEMGDFFMLRIYYPVHETLRYEERMHPRRTSEVDIADATVEEYLKGPRDTGGSVIPKDTKILGIYRGADKILYINLSDEFRRNFQGDVMAEFLLLKGLYESLISNIDDIQDVKVLVEGKELETLGGHLYLLYPLKDMVTLEIP